MTQGVTGSVTPPEFATTGSVVTLNYTLHTDSETGPIQETTLQSVAQANGLYKTGTTYQPFQVALGQNQVIYGFEQGLTGVKK
jgi:FKBP-type peptidyl-prolyl cis-trans isomerase 2